MKNKIYFCNVDFGTRLTGIERSSFKRAILFKKYLNKTPYFITVSFNLQLRENWDHYKKIGWIPKECKLFNLYEDILNLGENDTVKTAPTSLILEDGNLKDISETHARFYKHNSSFNMYLVWRDSNKTVLNYINYFHNKRKIRRDKFNSEGVRVVTQYLGDDGNVISEDIFSKNGRKRISRKFDHKLNIVLIELFNKNGLLVEVFENEHQLLSFWMKRKEMDRSVFLMDKNRVWSFALDQLRKVQNITVISVIHSNHLSRPHDLMKGRLNSNYEKILNYNHIVDACIVLTPQQTMDIKKRFNPPYTLITIPHAHDTAVIRSCYKKRNKRRLITLARLSLEKNLDQMIKIMEIVVKSHPLLELYIYGQGAQRAKLEGLIREKKLENNVFLPGYTENITNELNKSILYLATSAVEGFPLSFLESLSHGVPIISYDTHYGPQALITNEKNGFIISSNDTENMAQKIISLINQPEKLEEMSNQAYDVAEEFSMERVASIWEKELKKI